MKKENNREKAEKVKTIATRGRIFQGTVIKKFDRRAVVEFERTVRIAKYERFAKKKTKLHARIPDKMEIQIGDYVKVQECRPLSKIVNFVVIEVVRSDKKEEKK